MSGSLPEIGDWDAVFDETHVRTYLPFVDEETSAFCASSVASSARAARSSSRRCSEETLEREAT